MTENIEQEVYDSLCGQLVPEYRLAWVENAFDQGSICDLAYGQVYDAYGRLRRRLGVRNEDPDVESILDAMLEIQREMCRRMFFCGVRYAEEIAPRL